MQYIIIQYLIRLHKTTLFKTAIARSPEIHDLLRCERSMISWPLALCRPPRTPVSLCEARRRFCWLHCPAHYSPSQNPSGSLLPFLCLFKRKINSNKSVCWQPSLRYASLNHNWTSESPLLIIISNLVPNTSWKSQHILLCILLPLNLQLFDNTKFFKSH